MFVVHRNKMHDHNLYFVVYHNKVLTILCIGMLLYHHVMIDVLHDQDLYLSIVYTIYVLQFRILVDRYNPYYYNMYLDVLYFDDYAHGLFLLSMYEFRQQVFENELMLLHGKRVNEHHAMDNYFDLMNAMDHVILMNYEDVMLNVADDEYDVQYLMVVDILLIYHIVEMNFDVIHVEYVRFFHQLFLVLMNHIDQIHHVQSHLDENVVADDDEYLVKMIVIENVDVLNVLSMDNIIHNNLDMFLLYTVEYDDVQRVEQVAQLKNQQNKRKYLNNYLIKYTFEYLRWLRFFNFMFINRCFHWFRYKTISWINICRIKNWHSWNSWR
jgi:hypothetical protein